MLLSEKVEALTGPDRSVDLDIMRYAENIGGDWRNALRYTESIDAAMTLGEDDWMRADMLVTAMQGLGNPDYMKDGTWSKLLPIKATSAALKRRGL